MTKICSAVSSSTRSSPVGHRPSAAARAWRQVGTRCSRRRSATSCSTASASSAWPTHTRAGARMLAEGPVRAKLAEACGGLGQYVAHDLDELDAWLGGLEERQLAQAWYWKPTWRASSPTASASSGSTVSC
ncbi:DUF3182 family protein [Pseudomonas aeruginosa]|nr:DUF3182 family protein [Pseudomonas aeruginosa]